MNGTPTIEATTTRSTTGLLAVALGAATSAAVVVAALLGHRFGGAEVLGILIVTAVVLGLNLQQVPQRPLLSRLPDEWRESVVIRAERAAERRDERGTGHAA